MNLDEKSFVVCELVVIHGVGDLSRIQVHYSFEFVVLATAVFFLAFFLFSRVS